MIIKVRGSLVKKMRKTRFKIQLLLFIIVAATVGFFAVQQIHAGTLNTGLEFAAQTGLSGQDIRVTIARIIRIVLGFLGIIAVCLIMYAGFIWMNSGGNEEKISQAKLILRNAAIGLTIVLASFAIVSFIISRLLLATGGGGNTGEGGNNNGEGIGALGNGIVKSVYPEPFQRDVPRNTSIVVTFREPMLASSICLNVTGSPAVCAPGTKIKTSSVKIFKTAVGDNGATNLSDVTVTSNDNLTFIFKPAGPAYLGSPIEATNYTVNLTRDVKKSDGKDAFNLTDFRWTFEVNNLLDLVSPKIKSIGDAGIFPIPDDEADVVSGVSQAVQATGSVTINLQPNTYRAASATLSRIPAGPLEARVEGTNQCTDGNVTIGVTPNGNQANVGYDQPGYVNSTIDIVNNRVTIAPCALTLVLDPGFVAGDSWRIAVIKEQQSDTLTLGSKTYSFVPTAATPNQNQIRIGNNTGATASNIAAAVNSIHPELSSPSVAGNKVNLLAKIAGSSGNNFELSTSNSVNIAVSRMQGGSDQTTRYTIKGKEDQPKNSIIQINFNEAVNPLMVAGSSDEIADKLRVVNAEGDVSDGQACSANKDCRSYKCVSNLCEGDQLAGKFTVSNQYKTVEFISDVKCGVNGCGENIYCLPGNSQLKVEATAASLQPCTTNAECTFTPFTTCTQGVCNDSTNNKNFPTAPNANGILDLADNSLDGNRNDNPQGQTDIYNENRSIQDNGGRGDNYLWSFFVSDRLDLTAPLISSLSVMNGAGNVNLSGAIEIIFSKLMMSSSLNTGSVVIDNGINQVAHKLINLWSLANNPIGYWVRKEDRDIVPLDGRPDRTSAFLSHGQFIGSTQYQSQVGSGVKDIYQNCYKPSTGPSCVAGPGQPSCCRAANGNLLPTAILTPDGNCP